MLHHRNFGEKSRWVNDIVNPVRNQLEYFEASQYAASDMRHKRLFVASVNYREALRCRYGSESRSQLFRTGTRMTLKWNLGDRGETTAHRGERA